MAKHLENPTRKQKNFMTKMGLKYENWQVERDTPQEMVIRHRHSDREERLPKTIAV